VRHVDIGYFAQSLPGEDLAVRSGLLAVRNTSFIVKQDVRKVGDGTLVAEASIVYVTVDRSGQAVRVPEEWRTLFPHWPDQDASDATR
jgi:acyl-CoA thioesterase FadM